MNEEDVKTCLRLLFEIDQYLWAAWTIPHTARERYILDQLTIVRNVLKYSLEDEKVRDVQ